MGIIWEKLGTFVSDNQNIKFKCENFLGKTWEKVFIKPINNLTNI
jgi:hypothetical protein